MSSPISPEDALSDGWWEFNIATPGRSDKEVSQTNVSLILNKGSDHPRPPWFGRPSLQCIGRKQWNTYFPGLSPNLQTYKRTTKAASWESVDSSIGGVITDSLSEWATFDFGQHSQFFILKDDMVAFLVWNQY